MAARTSNGTGGGLWSATSTWSGGTVPVSGTDTVTIVSGDTVTVDSAACTAGVLIVGSDPGTGGTAAIKINASGANTTLNVNAGVTLGLRGDLSLVGDSGYTNIAGLNAASGASVIFDPPSSGQYLLNLSYQCAINLNGSTNTGIWPDSTGGNHVIFKTDLGRSGLASYTNFPLGAIPGGGTVDGGFRNVAFAEFSFMGTTTHLGVVSYRQNNANATTISTTNTTFDHSSYWILDEANATSAVNYTFSQNIFTNSIMVPSFADGDATVGFTIKGTPSGQTRRIQNNAFDKQAVVTFDWLTNCTFTGNICAGGVQPYNPPFWANDSYFNNNLIAEGLASATVGGILYSSIADCYFLSFLTSGTCQMLTNTTAKRCLFESPTAVATAWCFFNLGNLTVTECFALPNSSGSGTNLVSWGTTGQVSVFHCLQYAGSADLYGLLTIGAFHAAVAGCVAACQSNIIYYPSAVNFTSAILETGDSSYTVDAVTLAGNNGFTNPYSAECKYNSTTVQASTVGYYNLAVSLNHTYPNSQVGSGDITADPGFTDTAHRRLAQWGGTSVGGGTATYTAALATLLANPALLTQATTGLVPWVKAGYVPTNAAYTNATYAGDPLTTGADGKPLNGTIGPLGIPAIGLTLTGPTSGLVGAASTNFTVTPAATDIDTVTFGDGGKAGTFTPSSLTFTASAVAQTFTYTPATTGAITLTLTSGNGATITGSSATYTASAIYAAAGPPSGNVGAASTNFTVTPSGTISSDTITFSDASAGGTFTPSSLTWTASSAAKTFTYTPSAPTGLKTLTLTSGDSYTVTGSPLTYTASSGASATWTHIQDFSSTDPASSGTGTAVSGSSVMVGNLLVVAAGNFTAVLSGVTDSGGNSYTKLGAFNSTGSSIDLWYTVVTTGGILTVSCVGQSFGSIAISEFNPGVGGTITKDGAAATNHGTGTVLTTGNLTITTPDLVIAGFANGETAQVFTPNAGYIAGTNIHYSAGANVAVALIYNLNASSSPANPGGMLAGGTNSWAGVGCGFLATGGMLSPKSTGGAAMMMGM